MARAPDGESSSPNSARAPDWRRSALLACGVALAALGVQFSIVVDQRAQLISPAPTPMLYDRHGVFFAQIGAPRIDRNQSKIMRRDRFECPKQDTGEKPVSAFPHPAPCGKAGAPLLDYGYWPMKNLPDRIVRATLALEDRRFYAHPGVDPIAVAGAAWRRFRSGARAGASTLAMQIARMQHPAPRSLKAKIEEAATAVVLTQRYGREALLAHYLRLAPYGNGSHGIAHAARFYFDKPAEDLSFAEIALLSALPQSPTRLNPLRPWGLFQAKRRGARALAELARQKVIDGVELSLAQSQLKALSPQPPLRRPEALHLVLRYENLMRRQPLREGGDPRVKTSIDLDAQRRLTALARRSLNVWRGAGAGQVAAMVVERGSGAVVAALGSNDYDDKRAGAVDFTRAPRSPGSALKPFIYALALDRGVARPGGVLADLAEGASGVSNADGHFLGPMLPRQALANSRNVPAINLLRGVGLDEALHFLRKLGLTEISAPADSFGVAMALGALPTTLERLVRAYGALADDGMLGELVWFKDGVRPSSVRVMSADAARLVTSFLSDPMARLPSFPRYGPLEYPFPAAVKTGTSQGYRDAVTLAFTRDYIVGVWLGRPDAGTMTRLTGSNSAARLARAILIDLHKTTPGDLENLSFPPPQGRVPVELCLFGAMRASSAKGCGQTLTEWLRPAEIPAPEAETPIPARQRAWAIAEGYRVTSDERAPAETMQDNIRLSIVSPENDIRVWRNPDAPASLSRISLKALVEPKTPQVVWYVDGAPFALADPDAPLNWPLQKGAHQFQLRLPLRPGASKIVRITVE
ncbi:glycosyl transferase family 51 [Methylocella silvestris BL2]|uniref:peptidoglycan glycosyltransferase n=1 Tax=Methylocella silvestris (strain DSM 15510 / CIP 108128 / LMG 27833 / NCIMB 13906 / BL2) TaxID=395965 RepID=B8ENY4_METSB|nr:transglycosylase domain-containing protein [Methylocella silvestris]ACK49222.1 glycosyl transferase family 51 [Methylocella silvestris BL2]